MAVRSMAARTADRLRVSSKCGSAGARLRLAGGAGVFIGLSRGGGARRGRGQEGRFPDARPQRSPPAGGGDPVERAAGGGCRPSFQGWRLRCREGNWDRGGGRAPGGTDKGRGREGVRERGTDGRTGAGRGAEGKRPKWGDAKRKAHTERDAQREGQTHTGTHAEGGRDRVRTGGEVERKRQKRRDRASPREKNQSKKWWGVVA